MKIVKTILFSLVSLMLINSGLNKFFKYLPVPENLPAELVKDNAAFMEISWLMPLVATVEIIGGLLLLTPKTRPLGALVVFPVLVGVLLVHLTVAPDGLIMIFVIWAILIWIIIDNKDKYMKLIS